jgi:hypothetical protein
VGRLGKLTYIIMRCGCSVQLRVNIGEYMRHRPAFLPVEDAPVASTHTSACERFRVTEGSTEVLRAGPEDGCSAMGTPVLGITDIASAGAQ